MTQAHSQIPRLVCSFSSLRPLFNSQSFGSLLEPNITGKLHASTASVVWMKLCRHSLPTSKNKREGGERTSAGMSPRIVYSNFVPGNRSQKGSWRRANEDEETVSARRNGGENWQKGGEINAMQWNGGWKGEEPLSFLENRSRVQSRCLRFERMFCAFSLPLSLLSSYSRDVELIAKSARVMNDSENETRQTIRTKLTIIYKHILIFLQHPNTRTSFSHVFPFDLSSFSPSSSSLHYQ